MALRGPTEASETRSDTLPPGLLDPERFASQVLGVELWSKQREVLRAVACHRRVAVKSGNGLGKDFTAAVAVLWYLHQHDPAIVLSTAPTFRQVRHVLWRQIRGLYRRASGVVGGELLDTRLELAGDRYALGLSSTGADQFQGFHCQNMFIVVDEAGGVSEPIYEAIDAIMTSANPRLLLIGNPTTPSGAFHRAFYQESSIYETITISALESPNVVAGAVVIPGLTTAEWVAERRAVWGQDSPVYRARILGEFPDRAEDSLFSVSDIEAAVMSAEAPGHRDVAGPEPVVIGVDVARYGSDRSVVLVRQGDIVQDIQVYPRLDTMELVGRVITTVRERTPDLVNVDEVGIGAGVLDRLRELGIQARGVNGAARPLLDSICGNLRAEGYWSLRERFQNRRIHIPRDAELMAELTALRYRINSSGKVMIESKETIRGRGLPSPDKADALMLAFLKDVPPVALL